MTDFKEQLIRQLDKQYVRTGNVTGIPRSNRTGCIPTNGGVKDENIPRDPMGHRCLPMGSVSNGHDTGAVLTKETDMSAAQEKAHE